MRCHELRGRNCGNVQRLSIEDIWFPDTPYHHRTRDNIILSLDYHFPDLPITQKAILVGCTPKHIKGVHKQRKADNAMSLTRDQLGYLGAV